MQMSIPILEITQTSSCIQLYSILDSYNADSSKGSMNSTLNDNLEMVLAGKKINIFKSISFLYVCLATTKQTSKYSTLHPHNNNIGNGVEIFKNCI